jgi:hypothetical protein
MKSSSDDRPLCGAQVIDHVYDDGSVGHRDEARVVSRCVVSLGCFAAYTRTLASDRLTVTEPDQSAL